MQAYTTTNGPRASTAATVMLQGFPVERARGTDRVGSFSGVARSLTRGEELFAEGDASDFFYKVVSGTIRTYKLLSDGRRQIDEFHLAGDIFGLEPGDQHRFSAEAVEEASVIMFRRRRFALIAQEDPSLGDQVMTSLMRNLERAHDHMLLLGRKSAQERIATFLLDMSKRIAKGDSFDLPMQRSDIADHLGLTIETVSRTLTQFARDGLIKLAAASRSVVLCDKSALRRLDA
jgi:CRP/FNR family transcriptional regulator, nitrogen fixation regulation protein